MFVDYTQIRADLAALIVTNHDADFGKIGEELDFNLISFDSDAVCDVRLGTEDDEVRTSNNYYVNLTLEIEILATDLSSFLDSCKLRDSRVNSVKDTIRNNTKFSSSLESSRLVSTTFSSAQDSQEGPYQAAAVITILVQIYSDS